MFQFILLIKFLDDIIFTSINMVSPHERITAVNFDSKVSRPSTIAILYGHSHDNNLAFIIHFRDACTYVYLLTKDENYHRNIDFLRTTRYPVTFGYISRLSWPTGRKILRNANVYRRVYVRRTDSS